MTEPLPAPKSLDEAMLRLQANPPVLVKDQDGQVGNQKTKYAGLQQANEKVLSRLTELGVLWKTKPTLTMIPGPNGSMDPRFVLEWTLTHLASGDKDSGMFPLPAGAQPMQNGSAITYARRYALLAVTNSIAEDEDDDGQGYRGRQGMAQRANVQQERARPAAQRADGPAARPGRAAPTQQPELPVAVRAPRAERAPSGEPAAITQPMVGLLQGLVRKLAPGFDGSDAAAGDCRRAFIIDLIGREVASTKDLTFAEGRTAIDALQNGKNIRDVIAIYRRTAAGGEAPANAPEAAKPRGRGRTEKPAETRSVAEQTRDAILGRPAGPDDEAPPWETEPAPLVDAHGSARPIGHDGWPAVAGTDEP